ncbi:hypothetical protein Tcan_10703, partial [Toxocara canis]
KSIDQSLSLQSWNLLFAFCGFLCIASIVSYAIIAVCVRTILKTLSSAKFCTRVRDIQSQITIGMILQAMLPIIFSTLPMIFVIGLIVSPFDVHIGSYGSLIVAVLYWEPCVYPLLSLYFVRPLRDSIWGQKCLFKSTPVATSNFALGTIRK